MSEYVLEYNSGILSGLTRQPGYTTNSLRGCPSYRSTKTSENNSPFVRPSLPWKLSCEAEGLDRMTVWKIASAINMDTSGLFSMIVCAVLVLVSEPMIMMVLFKSATRGHEY